jgi:RNA polymerase sigma-70 factor (ECF subfamily)
MIEMRLVGSAAEERSTGGEQVQLTESFEEFFDAHRVPLYGALFAITRSRQEAEDISQEAFVKVWERWDRVRGMQDPVGYLHRTAMNVFRDRYRRMIMGLKRVARLAPPPDALEAVEARSVLDQVLGSLTPRERAAIVVTEGLGYSAEEAGRLLGIKGSTVRALRFRASRALKGSMEESIDG